MSFLRRAMATSLASPDGWLVRALGGHLSLTGLAVTAEAAESVSAVFAAVRIIAEGVAQLPLHLYARLDQGGKERAITHPLYRVLRLQPNPWQTPFEFWEMLVGHCALRGAGYAQKLYRGDGQVDALVPLHPDRLTPKLDAAGTPEFDYHPANGKARTFPIDDLFRLTTHSVDGITGRSPIAIAREAVGLSLATERYGARFFAKEARPGGILSHPGKLGKEARDRLRKQWQEQQGGDNAQGVAVLEEGLAWTQVGMMNKDAQFLESRSFQIHEIARLYRIPPHMMAELDRSTNNNIEQQALEYLTYTLQPWLERIQQAIYRDLFTTADQDRGYFAEFLVESLLRGDVAARNTAYATARQWGWLCVDEIREMENRNPLPNGEGKVYLEPLNMIETGQDRTLQFSPPRKALPPGDPPPDPEQATTLLAALLRDPLHRVARREGQVVREAFRTAGVAGLLAAYDGHAEIMLRTLGPLVEPAAALVAGGTLPAGAVELVRAHVTAMAEQYVRLARTVWTAKTGLTAAAIDAQLARVEAEMPPRLAVELAAGIARLVAGTRPAAVESRPVTVVLPAPAPAPRRTGVIRKTDAKGRVTEYAITMAAD